MLQTHWEFWFYFKILLFVSLNELNSMELFFLIYKYNNQRKQREPTIKILNSLK